MSPIEQKKPATESSAAGECETPAIRGRCSITDSPEFSAIGFVRPKLTYVFIDDEQMSKSLNSGVLVHARVRQVEVFGVFCDFMGHEILVLIPDISWIPCFASCEQFAEIGDELDIKIVNYDKERNQFAGSIRAIHPENDPWGGPWKLNVGDVMEATVVRWIESADRCGQREDTCVHFDQELSSCFVAMKREN